MGLLLLRYLGNIQAPPDFLSENLPRNLFLPEAQGWLLLLPCPSLSQRLSRTGHQDVAMPGVTSISPSLLSSLYFMTILRAVQ